MTGVVSLHGLEIEPERRKIFLAAVAQSYDIYQRNHGVEPEAIVYVLGGLKQTASVAWHLEGDSRGGPTSMLAFAQALIMKEIINPDE